MLLLLACALTICSDDVLGVLGNEVLEWDHSETATYYIVAKQYWIGETPAYAECANTVSNWLDLRTADCYADEIVVKACKPSTDGGPDLCSDYNADEPVEILPFACLSTTDCVFSDDGDARNDRCLSCERPCWSGAPRRMPNLAECP